MAAHEARQPLAGAQPAGPHRQVLPVAAHASLRDAIRVYLAGIGRQPREAAIAMANPVTGDLVRMTNHPWVFSQAELQAAMGIDMDTHQSRTKEIDPDEFDLNCKCPKCGFEFDAKT